MLKPSPGMAPQPRCKFKDFSKYIADMFKEDAALTALLPGDWGSRVACSSKMNYQDHVDDLDELYQQAEAILALLTVTLTGGHRGRIEPLTKRARGGPQLLNSTEHRGN